MASLEAMSPSPVTQDGSAAVPDEPSTSAQARALAAIATHNQEFRIKCDSLLSVPLALLVEQRDRALFALEEARLGLENDRSTLIAEQDTFIAFLMEDHQKQLAALDQQLSQAKLALERQAILAPAIHAPLATGGDAELRESLARAEEHIAALREQLENAYREVDESRSDGWRLQEERDEAVRTTDDLRIELLNQLDATRDEAARLQLALDEANRALEDTRDEAREEASRLIEELDSVRNECDERRAEVVRLRERLENQQSDYRASVPPPPPQSDELELARAEAKVVRKQLIDSKRELSRLTRELDLARAQRAPLYRVTPTGGLRPSTRTGTTQPGMTSSSDAKPGDSGTSKAPGNGESNGQ
jgi:chromosome segregation ATPase